MATGFAGESERPDEATHGCQPIQTAYAHRVTKAGTAALAVAEAVALAINHSGPIEVRLKAHELARGSDKTYRIPPEFPCQQPNDLPKNAQQMTSPVESGTDCLGRVSQLLI